MNETIIDEHRLPILRAGLVAKFGPWGSTVCMPLQYWCRPVWVLHNIVRFMGYPQMKYVEIGQELAVANQTIYTMSQEIIGPDSTVDMIATPRYALTAERVEAGIPYIFPAQFFDYSVFIRKPEVEKYPIIPERFTIEHNSLLHPFTLDAWLSLSALIIIVFVLQSCVQKALARVGFVNPADANGTVRSVSFALVRMTSLTLCAFVTIHYSANLKATAVGPMEPRNPIKDLAELATVIRRGRYSLITEATSEYEWEYLSNSRLSEFRNIQRALRVNPVVVIPANSTSKHNNSCIITANSIGKHYVFIATEEKAKLLCRHHFSKLIKIPTKLSSKMMATYLVSPRLRHFRHALSFAIKSGVYEAEELRFKQFVCGVFGTCFSEAKVQHAKFETATYVDKLGKSITDEEFWALFFAYFMVMCVAGLIFGAELLAHAAKRKRDAKQGRYDIS